jgi:hypothetical protein
MLVGVNDTGTLEVPAGSTSTVVVLVLLLLLVLA